MAQVSGVSITCGHASETRGASRIGRPGKHFFILEVCGPQRVVGHVAAPEPSQAGRQSLVLWDTWQCRSPPEQGGRIQSRGKHDSVGAHLSREAGSEAIGHMAMLEPS
jgi:hypothetical protein